MGDLDFNLMYRGCCIRSFVVRSLFRILNHSLHLAALPLILDGKFTNKDSQLMGVNLIIPDIMRIVSFSSVVVCFHLIQYSAV